MRRSTEKGTAAKSRAVQVAAAVAREAVVTLHVEHALALIRHAAGRVTEMRMLEIYLRLLGLTGPAGEAVGNRVLASLGHMPLRGDTRLDAGRSGSSGASDSVPDDGGRGGDVVDNDDGSLLRMLRRRLRGRVHDKLRRTVELQVGVAKAALLETHVSHAHGFVRLLADTHGMSEACVLYSEMVHMPPSLAAVLYMLVVDRIAAEEAPAFLLAAPEAGPKGTRVAPHKPLEHGLPRRAGQRSIRGRTSA
ncbi:hypothetical protein BH23GEM9_BH23GEM9_25600 [soil metagenome]